MDESMDDERLRIYLSDHLALMVGELELAVRCRSANNGTALGEFLSRLETEIGLQKAIVDEVLERIGGKESRLKNSAAWIAEKLGRFKLNGSLLKYSDLSRLVELEALAAASLERTILWQTLDLVLKSDARSVDYRFDKMRDRSQGFLDELNEHHRTAASWAFVGD
jgi:hypothetical protein